MAKSNRRRKQDRAKAATKHAEARRRRPRTARIRAMEMRLARIHDPGTPAAELAALLAEQYQDVPVAGWLAPALLAEGSSLERLEDAAQPRGAEAAEVARAIRVQHACEIEHGPAHDAFDRVVI